MVSKAESPPAPGLNRTVSVGSTPMSCLTPQNAKEKLKISTVIAVLCHEIQCILLGQCHDRSFEGTWEEVISSQ